MISREVIVNLISNTTTEKGFSIQACLDINSYPTQSNRPANGEIANQAGRVSWRVELDGLSNNPIAAEGLTRLVEATRYSGVALVYENHAKPGAWQHTDFSQPPEVFLEVARRTADVGLKINFDTGNAAAFTDDPLVCWRKFWIGW